MHEGDVANSYYIIKKGKVVITSGKSVIKKMGELETFGEQALMGENSRRNMTVIADT